MKRRKRSLTLFIFLTYIIIVSPLSAQQTNNQNQTQITEETELIIADENTPALPQDDNQIKRNLNAFSFWDFIRMILILVFVIACIYGLFFILRKAGSQKFKEDDLINIISSKSIATGKTMHIVEVGNQIMVIGAADNAISTLFEITDKDTIDNIRLHKEKAKKPSEGNFQQYLYNMIFKGKGEKKSKSFNETFAFDYLKKQRGRIKKM
ncbi:MAG: flagellar biosynthetic protein FliO [Spirochaetaceae bacterium]|nr:flagellar biosynthetic protein FliO [Spirochaetaceae bacterium]